MILLLYMVALMANDLTSNITRKLLRTFLKKFESSRVLTKATDSQLFQGKLNPSSGSVIDIKRPHDYNSIRTPGGDISGANKSEIIAGKATAVVQDYFTAATEWANIEEALELDQLEEIINPMAARIVTDLEVDYARFMMNNTGLVYGDPDVAVTKWSDVAGAGALMQATGVPMDDMWSYVMNPFVNTALADTQTGLSSGKDSLVDNAWEMAQISKNFGGLKAMTSNALGTRLSGDTVDREGTLDATPAPGYLTAKDTMTQSLDVTGFDATGTINAGDIIQITGRNRLNLSTRQVILDGDGAEILWTATVVTGATMVAGAGTIIVTGPAIQETDGQYNTVDTALTSGDVITILGSAATNYQPSLFFHRQAFSIATVKLPKLFATDTTVVTEDGFSIRVSKYADGDANIQKVRFDLLPAFAVLNPFFAGQGFGKV